MADMRYLKRQSFRDARGRRRQGHSWFFVIAVPKAVQGSIRSKGRGGRPGRPLTKIVTALGTQSLREAQERRWSEVAKWREQFTRALNNTPLTRAEIEAEARELYTAELERMAADAKRRPSEDEAEALSVAIDDLLGEFVEPDATGDADQYLERHADFEFVQHIIAGIERREGVKVEPDTDTYRVLGRAIVRALLAAYEGRRLALRGEPSEPPATFLGADGIDPVTLRPIDPLPRRPVIRIGDSKGMRFSEAAAIYLAELQRDPAAKVTEQTLIRHKAIYRLFQDFTRDPPLAAIDKATASEFIDTVAKLDPDWGAKADKEMSFRQLVEKFGQGPRHLSNATLNKYAHALSGLLKWADRRGHFDGRNPFEGQSRAKPKGTGWRAYATDELNLLFGSETMRSTERIRPPEHNMTTALCWLPLVALFSGMRQGEIAQLRPSDVQRRDGVWAFRVTAEGDDQHVKSEAGVRIVPVHSELIRCGFLEYVKALPEDAAQLWPGLKRGGPDNKLGWHFPPRFTQYRRACGVNGTRTVFHSFRKNTAQALKDARVTPAEIAELIGHERGFTVETYAPLQLQVTTLHELIERVRYSGLKLDHLHIGHRDQ